MPKSKRAKVVALTKVKKKGKDWKDGLFQRVRDFNEKFNSVYAIEYENMRNYKMQELREELRDSSAFMLASTKKLQAAIGREPEEECRPGVHRLCPYLKGSAGLFFTNLAKEKVVAVFEDFMHEDYARAGSLATETFTLPAGAVIGPGGQPFPHTMEHTLRGLGMPTKLNKGVIELLAEYTVCVEGQALSSNQASLLRHFDIKMAAFRLRLKAAVHGQEQGSVVFEDMCEEI